MLSELFRKLRYDTQKMYIYTLNRLSKDILKETTVLKFEKNKLLKKDKLLNVEIIEQVLDSVLNDTNRFDVMIDLIEGDIYNDSIKAMMTSALRKYYKAKGRDYRDIRNEINTFSKKSKDNTDFLKTYHDISNLIKSCKTIEEELLVRSFLQTGIRRSITLQLKPNDVNEIGFEIPAEYIGNKKKEKYSVTIYDDIFKRKILSFIKDKSNDELIFNSLFEGIKTMDERRRLITDLITEIGGRCGIFVKPHMLKHTFGTWFYLWKKDIELTRMFLGQNTYDATKRYVNSGKIIGDIISGNEERKEDANKIIKLLFNGKIEWK